MRLALFDLDGTLIAGDSDHAFGEFMVTQGWTEGELHRRRNDEFYRQYLAGCLDIAEYIDFSTRAWRELGLDEQLAVSARFMAEVMTPQLLPAARALLDLHRAAGDLVAIVTATNEFITRPIADALGVEPGRAAFGVHDVPSFREGKIERVHDWLAGLGQRLSDVEHSVFYSDSTNDLPLLEIVSEPVATNPSPALEAIALQRGWRILRLFA